MNSVNIRISTLEGSLHLIREIGTKCVSIDDGSVALEDSRGRIASAGHELRDFRLSIFNFEWESNPRAAVHGGLEACFISVTRNCDNLQVLGTICIDFGVKIFQVGLERSAATSPGGGVEDHNNLVTLYSVDTFFIAASIYESRTELLHILYYK